MSFTYDLATDIGKVRFEIGDTTSGTGVKPDGSNITDEELQVVLTREGSTGRATAAACEALARMYARFVDLTVGPHREALSQASEAYARQAQELRRQYGGGSKRATAGGVIKQDGFNAGLDYASDAVTLASGNGEYAPVALTVYLDY